MPARHLCKAVNIKAYILKQEAKAKATSRKATDRKKMLLKMRKAIKRAHEEIDHFHLKCNGYILERTMLKDELQKSLEQISQVSWDVVAQMALL